MNPGHRRDWVAGTGSALHGDMRIPGDKSISHRAIMLAAIADGVSRIDGFLEGEDTRATAAIFGQLGVRIDAPQAGLRLVHGVGVDGLRAPSATLDCGNAGTAMRLLAGLLCGQGFSSTLTGDASLAQRPMQRVIEPLSLMGSQIRSDHGRPPLCIGGGTLHGIDYTLPVASAQVKSAVLLAALSATGVTCVREPNPTRDYTERMLRAFGAEIQYSPGFAQIPGRQRLQATDISVPADFSSAAFFIVAATLVPGSELRLQRVGINPRRTGLLHVLRGMGADIREENSCEHGGETIADLVVRYAPLRGIEVPAGHVPDMIDEFPALFIAAACAEGATTIRGASELRVKESDRIATMAAGLRNLGIVVDETPDGATVHGGRLHGGIVDTHGDHRVAMAFATAAQRARGEVRIADITNVATSFPDFEEQARRVGFQLG
ncbi:MAG: 3-phosphoshikimate 1-carboxyvinyltransferase [Luteimonas sp.]